MPDATPPTEGPPPRATGGAAAQGLSPPAPDAALAARWQLDRDAAAALLRFSIFANLLRLPLGITPKQQLAGLLMFITDIHSLGLKNTQSMYLTEGFYWNLNDETRAWSKRFFDLHKRTPTMVQAGQYSSVMHYLKAVKTTGTGDTAKVMAEMKKTRR